MENRKFPPENDIKNRWRNRLKTIRNGIDSIRKSEASLLACETLPVLCHEALFILSFASFASEIDLWPFNHILMSEGRLVLPRVQEKNLTLYQVLDDSCLEKHPIGFLEPIPSSCKRIELSKIDIALIPGLGFDLQTHFRLGYGKGFYDRLLAHKKNTQSWGIGFREQSVEKLPYEPHDQPLDKIVLF